MTEFEAPVNCSKCRAAAVAVADVAAADVVVVVAADVDDINVVERPGVITGTLTLPARKTY